MNIIKVIDHREPLSSPKSEISDKILQGFTDGLRIYRPSIDNTGQSPRIYSDTFLSARFYRIEEEKPCKPHKDPVVTEFFSEEEALNLPLITTELVTTNYCALRIGIDFEAAAFVGESNKGMGDAVSNCLKNAGYEIEEDLKDWGETYLYQALRDVVAFNLRRTKYKYDDDDLQIDTFSRFI